MKAIDDAKQLWDFHTVHHEPEQSDVIVGLGSYDLRVAAHCAELFLHGLAPSIVFSGAHGNWTNTLFAETEAQAFAEHATANGVPAGAIVLERMATNIGENMRFCARLFPNARSAIIVTKPQTQLRALATAQAQWPSVSVCVTAPEISFEEQPLPHHDMRELICEMVGDFARMDEYARLGFQTKVNIPPEARAAFNALVAAGYADHLP